MESIPIYQAIKIDKELYEKNIDKDDLAYIIKEMENNPEYSNIPAFWIEYLQVLHDRMED